jgi:hypothetical protein
VADDGKSMGRGERSHRSDRGLGLNLRKEFAILNGLQSVPHGLAVEMDV